MWWGNWLGQSIIKKFLVIWLSTLLDQNLLNSRRIHAHMTDIYDLFILGEFMCVEIES
jgi:hypothetical protein